MTREYNYQAFTPEECKKGLHLKLIQSLLEISEKFEDSHFEFHITTDGYCIIIEWIDVNQEYEDDYWKFVDYEHEVMYRVEFPDNHYEYVSDEDEAKELLDEWLKENPGWKKNEYGHWYNEKEQEDWTTKFEQGELKPLKDA